MIYYWLSRIHRKLVRSIQPEIPTISVGNFAMGGTGKTPLVIYIASELSRRGANVVVLSRGYGRKDRKVQLVMEDSSWEEVGDEPMVIFLKTGCRVLVHKDRVLTYMIAKDTFQPDFLLLDDALQYWKISPHVSIAILNRDELDGWKVFPFGMYREPIDEVKRVDLVIVNNGFGSFTNIKEFRGKRAFEMRYVVKGIFEDLGKPADIGEKVVAFCGIAKCQRFKETLNMLNVEVEKLLCYPDHHAYTKKDVDLLNSYPYPKITTLKDFVKLRGKVDDLYFVDVEVELDEPSEFFTFLANVR